MSLFIKITDIFGDISKDMIQHRRNIFNNTNTNTGAWTENISDAKLHHNEQGQQLQ
jgi:hypothetical protein